VSVPAAEGTTGGSSGKERGVVRTVATDWTEAEVKMIVRDYMEMLSAELRGEAYVKAEHRRRLEAMLNHRTKAAIERKHQNISAVLREMGSPFIQGYKPLRNYQALLKEVVHRAAEHHVVWIGR
jgi:hypothetical protein